MALGQNKEPKQLRENTALNVNKMQSSVSIMKQILNINAMQIHLK